MFINIIGWWANFEESEIVYDVNCESISSMNNGTWLAQCNEYIQIKFKVKTNPIARCAYKMIHSEMMRAVLYDYTMGYWCPCALCIHANTSKSIQLVFIWLYYFWTMNDEYSIHRVYEYSVVNIKLKTP